MIIELNEISIRDLVVGYQDNEENGVFGYDGRLDIRPPYQREFIYKAPQRDAVINTITKNFPLNVMYWAVKDDDKYEIIDGQQRTISICQYVEGDFAFEGRYFHNLQSDEKEQILNYKLMIYFCNGTPSERLDWFETINIAGIQLKEQELRNAVYSGPFITDAKRYFSKTGCPVYQIAGDYLNGVSLRQDYLETAIKWISNDSINEYMATHQHEDNANELWLYIQAVINWVKVVFPTYRHEMKGVEWGFLYNQYKDKKFSTNEIEDEVKKLMLDDDVTNKKGIYRYVLSRNEKYLNIRKFTENQKREAYEKQQGLCPICKKVFDIKEMEADHITPWREGGKTSSENCQMLCKEDNRIKSFT